MVGRDATDEYSELGRLTTGGRWSRSELRSLGSLLPAS